MKIKKRSPNLVLSETKPNKLIIMIIILGEFNLFPASSLSKLVKLF